MGPDTSEDLDVPLPVRCRKYNYEKTIGQYVYCGKPEEECVYRSKEKFNGEYRCMMREKML